MQTNATEVLCEKLPVKEGTLIINRKYMALQTPDGVLHPADLDRFIQYKRVWDLIRLVSCNADLTTEITDEALEILYQAFAGKHQILDFVGFGDTSGRKKHILDQLKPTTENDFVRALCLNSVRGIDIADIATIPFVSREELREYLTRFMPDDYAFDLSEAVRKGLLFEGPERQKPNWIKYQEQLDLLPKEIPELFRKIKYLPSREIYAIIVRYAIIAAKSIARNGNDVILYG